MQAGSRDKGVDLSVEYDMFLPGRFRGDPGRIRQVLTNLIGNAVKFTEAGHVIVRATGVQGADGMTELHVSIEDTGIGIPADKAKHIFGEFNQVDEARNRKFEGSGLGLAISQQLIGKMGGRIWVESEEGVGSTFGFTLTLPAAEALEAEDVHLPEGLRTVLVVDPQATRRAVLERQMGALGLSVTGAESGAAALAALPGAVDLVLTAHTMPEMDGMELAEAMRAAGHEMPVLVLSADPDVAEQDPARAHVQGVLPRPLQRSDIFAALRGLDGAFGPAMAGGGGRAMRVLAAEDNRTNRLVFSKMVAALDIELRFAGNGVEAVEGHHEFAPDLIFMDISMPEMDGKAATRCIREAEAKTGRHVPIVAMTAHAMGGDEADILAAGLDRYMTKPLSKAAITAEIAAACPAGVRPPGAGVQAAC